MEIQAVIATTHIDAHNMKATKEALESAALQSNGPRKLRIGLEHDTTIPPLGKALRAWVEPTGDGEFRLVSVGEMFEKVQVCPLPDGTVLLKQESEIDKHPFVLSHSRESKGFGFLYDRVNFGSDENRQAFLDEVLGSAGEDVESAEFFRKSLIPDPEIIVRLSEVVVQYLIAKKLIDKAGEKLIDLAIQGLGRFYALVRALTSAAVKYAIPKNRPITYVFEMAGIPFIQFVVVSADPAVVLSALAREKLEKCMSKAADLATLLNAEMIQFLMNVDNEWELNYLLTSTGAVIGTEKSFSRRTKRLELMGSVLPPAISFGSTDLLE